MYSKTIISLAILKVNWDILNKDYIENFVPFFTHLIKKIGYTKIEVNKLRSDFETEFGINVPYHPAMAMLTRMKQKGIIRKKNEHFEPVIENLQDSKFEEISNEQEQKIEQLINAFIDFYHQKTNNIIDNYRGEEIFLSFLNEYDTSILFLDKEEKILPAVSAPSEAWCILQGDLPDYRREVSVG